ncbi:SDR family NAD(P)-dependent oxidoreductase [Sporomusa sp.]|uniref:SDR family NAD(P)-dependent oxidoreductase n=1 Tax=Sporomusa sp. TaxID=2078658 RepID=UPI002BCEC1F2|nr:SDR family NAD(P)-dependent oxidoreductase [Sporomusa sp.]HWR43567.1 SDR family NAD(P)-dependent oxidoreductase [Sporomusa sp.]
MQDETIRIFDGAVAIITGGASGIGAALGRELTKRGCEVILGDRQIELAEEVAAAIRHAGGKATAAELNAVDYDAVEALVYETVNRTGRLDYMFNNAGIAMTGPAIVYKIEDWNAVIDVNLWGVIHGVQAAYKVMLEQGFGHIVNTASLAGLLTAPGRLSYATTKHAIVGLSKTLRIEAAMQGIRVSVFCPGFVRTPIIDRCGKYGKVLKEPSPEQQEKLNQLVEKCKPIPPDIFAQKALDAVARNEAIIVIPSRNKLFWWFDRLFPEWNLWLTQKKLAEYI